MQYWRMQVHPNDSANAMAHTVNSIAAGFIGLDFERDPGDLRRADLSRLSKKELPYAAISSRMAKGDKVLVFVHLHPFALVTVDSDYNYIARQEPEIGVWFRHFRRIDKTTTQYYADHETDPKKWQRIVMSGTLFPLHKKEGANLRLIEKWVSKPRG